MLPYFVLYLFSITLATDTNSFLIMIPLSFDPEAEIIKCSKSKLFRYPKKLDFSALER